MHLKTAMSAVALMTAMPLNSQDAAAQTPNTPAPGSLKQKAASLPVRPSADGSVRPGKPEANGRDLLNLYHQNTADPRFMNPGALLVKPLPFGTSPKTDTTHVIKPLNGGAVSW